MGTARAQDIKLPSTAPEDSAPDAPLAAGDGLADAAPATDPFVAETLTPAVAEPLTPPDAGWGNDLMLAGLIVLLVLLALAAARILRLTEALRVVHDDELAALGEARELRRLVAEARQAEAVSSETLDKQLARATETAARERDELVRTNRLLQGMVRCDVVTGLANGTYLARQLAKELRRAMRSRRPLSILVFDIVGFRRYNDARGHEQGDELLKRIGALLGSHFQRGGDLVARTEADRFVVVMPDTPRDDVITLAQKMVQRVAEEAIPSGKTARSSPVKISWGIASATSNKLLHPQQLVAEALQALAESRRPARRTRKTTAARKTTATGTSRRKTAATAKRAKPTAVKSAKPTDIAETQTARSAAVAATKTAPKRSSGGASAQPMPETAKAAPAAQAADQTAAAAEGGVSGTLFPEQDQDRAASGS